MQKVTTITEFVHESNSRVAMIQYYNLLNDMDRLQFIAWHIPNLRQSNEMEITSFNSHNIITPCIYRPYS